MDNHKRVNQNTLRNYHNDHDNKDEKIILKSKVNHEEFDEVCSMEIVETIPSTLRTKGYAKNTSIIHSSIQKVCSISMIFKSSVSLNKNVLLSKVLKMAYVGYKVPTLAKSVATEEYCKK